jgi:hypothetical protein
METSEACLVIRELLVAAAVLGGGLLLWAALP